MLQAEVKLNINICVFLLMLGMVLTITQYILPLNSIKTELSKKALDTESEEGSDTEDSETEQEFKDASEFLSENSALQWHYIINSRQVILAPFVNYQSFNPSMATPPPKV